MNKTIHDASELRTMILKNPDLPIVVLVNGEMVGDDYCCWWYANSVRCTTGIILDTELPFNDYKTYIDKGEFEEDLSEWMWCELCDELDEAEPYEDAFEKMVKEKMKFYEPYWKRVIEVWCDN